MKIFARILALLLIVPTVELISLLWLSEVTSMWTAIGLIVLSALVGGYLLKREGIAAWRRFNDRLGVGDLPGDELIDGIIILCSGALLMTPGVFTDFVGLAGLFPPTRALIRKQIQKRVRKAMSKGVMAMSFGEFGGAEWEGGHSYTPYDSAPDASEYDAKPEWGGSPTRSPGHVEQVPQPRPRGPEGDAV